MLDTKEIIEADLSGPSASPSESDTLDESGKAFERLRSQLVRTELSNPLLHFEQARKNRGIEITNLEPDSMITALAKAGSSSNGQVSLKSPTLSTPYSPDELVSRLTSMEREARTFTEERGAHALYLSIGILKWTDTISGETHQSPLLLVPVQLSTEGKYQILYQGQEIEENVALRKRLKEEFNIELPPLSEIEQLSPSKYFREVGEALRGNPACNKFEIKTNEISLGLFSFGNLLMYRDLEPSQWAENRKPWKHPVLSTILDGGFVDAGPIVPQSKRIEDAIPLKDRLDVLSADSSQKRVLEEVGAGKSVVVEGPPGTGKSVTIVNMIANAVAQGKKVLLTSEKKEALRVAKSWLETAGLGDICLEIQSDTTRRAVIEELKRTTELGPPKNTAREEIAAEVEVLQTKLNQHVDLLKSKVKHSGLSVYEVLSRELKQRSSDEFVIPLNDASIVEWNSDELKKAVEHAKSIATYHRLHSSPKDNPFYGVKLTEYPETALTEAIQQLTDSGDTLWQMTTDLFKELRLEPDLSDLRLQNTIKALSVINELYTDNGKLVEDLPYRSQRNPSALWQEHGEEITKALGARLTLVESAKRFSRINLEKLREAPLDSIEMNVRANSQRSFLTRWADGAYSDAKESLNGITVVPKTHAQQLILIQELKAMKQLLQTCDQYRTLLEDIIGPWPKEQESNLRYWQRLVQVLSGLNTFHQALKDNPNAKKLTQLLYAPMPVYALGDKLSGLSQSAQEFCKLREELLTGLSFNEEQRKEKFDNKTLSAQLGLLRDWHQSPDKLKVLVDYNKLRKTGEEAGFGFITTQSECAQGVAQALPQSVEKAWINTLAKYLERTLPTLQKFHVRDFETSIKRFQSAWDSLRESNSLTLAEAHWKAIPRIVVGGQVGTLFDEFEKRSGHMPLRQLLREAGRAIQQIKPVFLMSPQMVAKHLDPNAVEFDLGILEESSQLKRAHALGTMLRVNQVVVVGDKHQLDPTSYFETASASPLSESKDDEQDSHLESIADLFRSAHAPEQQLNWHYRSQRSGLIDLSNATFYQNRLKVFPTSTTGDKHYGLSFKHIEDGVYEPGTTRTNIVEAKAVAKAVLKHANERPEETLGVITLNQPQMQAILDEIETLRESEPELDRFLRSHKAEPFFVKNLETAQGDERDRIFISLGYARTEDGKLSTNFGPLNGEAGPKRLNVLMTRQRLACKVFSSMSPDEPELEESQNPTVKLLQNFMRHAADEQRELKDRLSAKTLDPFQQHMKAVLEQHGYEVHAGVGPPGSGIDLAIVDKKDPKRYLLGIQCDGFGFQDIESAHDRHKLVPQVLESRGWRLRREWVMEWYRDPERSEEKLLTAIREAIRDKNDTPSGAAPQTRTVKAVERLKSQPETKLIAIPYKRADIDLRSECSEVNSRDVTEKARAKAMTTALTKIVEIEGPIHRDELLKRIAQTCGARNTDKLAQAYGMAEQIAKDKKHIVGSGEFLFANNDAPIFPRDRSELRGSLRELSNIAPEEIEAAMIVVAKYSFGIRREEMPDACMNILGYQKPPRGAAEVVNAKVTDLMRSHVLSEIDGFLHINMEPA